MSVYRYRKTNMHSKPDDKQEGFGSSQNHATSLIRPEMHCGPY